MIQRIRGVVVAVLGVLLCFFTLAEVNFPRFQEISERAVFVGLGLVLCFLVFPIHPRLKENRVMRCLDVLLAIASIICCAYVFLQTEPFFERFWMVQGSGDDVLRLSLGDRVGIETTCDFVIGGLGLIIVLEATRRSIGLIVPLLALVFVAHSYFGPQLPDWLLPHGGQNVQDIVSTTFLQMLGVFGPAADVMFRYVFLFVVFGSFLEMSGATQFIIDFAERVFGRSPGGPAKVSVLGSGLMGSLSGSAVANAVTTGTFTIPMMRNAGFERHVAGGITAAAAAGGALVPPVMGAGAYMMLEIVTPPVTFLEVARAALIPAILYYLSIFMIVHFYARRTGVKAATSTEDVSGSQRSLWQFEGVVFFGALVALVGLLVLRLTPFRAVTGALVVILVMTTLRRQLKLGTNARVLAIATFVLVTVGHRFFSADLLAPEDVTAFKVFEGWLGSAIIGMFGLLVFGLIHPAWRPSVVNAFTKSAKNGIPLVAASACVGIIIGIVQQTGIATDFSAVIKGVVETNLFLALVGIMVCSIILGMGVPSVVCYLLMATLMGSLLGELGVIPLAAHLFIFYFGMMSMVTPPVALAAYASASIAEAKIMQTALAAFRFSLVGFTLPFMFVYRPALLLMDPEGALLSWSGVPTLLLAVLAAVVGIVALAAGIAGYLRSPLSLPYRTALLAAAALLLVPGMYVNVIGGALFMGLVIVNWRQSVGLEGASGAN